MDWSRVDDIGYYNTSALILSFLNDYIPGILWIIHFLCDDANNDGFAMYL